MLPVLPFPWFAALSLAVALPLLVMARREDRQR